MSSRSVSLNEHFDKFMEQQLQAGKYKSAREVLEAGLSLLEKQAMRDAKKLENLRAAIQVGIDQLDRGEGIQIEGEAELREFIHGLRKPSKSKTTKRRAE